MNKLSFSIIFEAIARSDGLHFDMKPSSSYSAVEEIESDRGVSRLPVHHTRFLQPALQQVNTKIKMEEARGKAKEKWCCWSRMISAR